MSEDDSPGNDTIADCASGVDVTGAGPVAHETPERSAAARERPADLSAEVADSEAAKARWMLRDDEFLFEEDREYVIRDEGRSWSSYVSPVLFGAVVAVMLADVITTGVGTAMGLTEVNPVAAAVVAEAGLGGLVLLKTMAAVVLLALPGVTGDARRTFRAGSAAYLFVGLLVVAVNAWALVAVA